MDLIHLVNVHIGRTNHTTKKCWDKFGKLPIEFNHGLQVAKGHQLIYIYRYQRLVGKLIYLTLTRPDISYVGVANHVIHTPTTSHLEEAYHILHFLKKSLGQGLLYGKQKDLRVEVFTNAN